MPSRSLPPSRKRRGPAALMASLLALALAVPAAGWAQPRPERPDGVDDYAITGARVVTVSGGTLQNATVLVSDGVITAVGADVTVPADAWVVDGAGKTVYPGFIDAFGTLGHPAGGSRAAAEASDEPHSWGAADRPGTRSWRSAGEGLDASDERLEAWRRAGFTTAVSTHPDGLVPGQAAILNLGRVDRPREMVVATPVGVRVNLDDESYSGYPGSLMGSFAYLKQLWLDAAWYDRVWDDYEADPRGKARPEWDPALEPLRDQMEEGWPVLFPAENRKEIERAIETAGVMGVPLVVYGARAGYGAADLLAESGTPALVSLDWPAPPRDADPADLPSLATLRFWDRAATTPAELERAGVPFAFYAGDGAEAAGEALAGVREAVAHGLSPDAAIRALTLGPAEIFGVADRLGSVEPGKIANLVVASGDILEPGTRIETVFVDGDRVDVLGAGEGRTAQADDAEAEEEAELVPMAEDKGPYRDDPVTLIRNATVMTASDGTLENASVLVRDGRIAAVGPDVEAPSGARVVDATGKWVIPGIIDAHSHIAADAINEGAVNVSSMVGIQDVIEPNDVGIYRALAGGVTTINILHGSANPIGGGNAVVKLRWGGDKADLLIDEAHPGIKFALGENTKRDRDPDRYPATRMGVQDVVRQAFLEAREYQAAWDAWEASGGMGVEPRRDLELEALAEILRGDRWVHSHSYRADEILQLIRLAEEQGFTVRTFQHVLEGYKVADEIAAHGAGASTFSDWWAYKVEAYDAIPYNAALMAERGVLVSINSDSGEEMRHLNQEAAKAIKWGGMDREEALKLVTLNPAIQLGIEDRVGSIEVGKDADLVIYDGDPLSVFARVEQTYVDGKLYFDIEMDAERQRAIDAEKAALLERYGPDGSGAGAVTDRVAPTHQNEMEDLR